MTTPMRALLAALCLAGAPSTALWPATAAAADAPAATGAATPASELAQLREQLAQLRQTLDRLEQRLQQMQNAPPAAAVPASSPAIVVAPASPAAAAPARAPDAAAGTDAPQSASTAPAAAPLDAHQQAVLQEQVRTADALNAWQGLRNGMSQADVRRRLGEPQSTLTVGNRTGWIYTYRNAGKGSVFFSSEGTVVSLMSPGQGALHLY